MAIEGDADWIFHGGAVHPMDGTEAVSELAVRDGRIVAVGERVRDLVGPETHIADLQGGALLPGFQDAHVHAVAGGLQRLGCDLSGVHHRADYRRLVAEHGDRHRDDPWLEGSGWYGDVFPGGFPHRDDLDDLVPDRPVVLTSHDCHGVWVNSAALRRAGITATTPDPEGGRIQRDPDGEPTGLLLESAAGLVTRLLPPPDSARLRAALLAGQRYLHELGITAWQDAAVGDADLFVDSFDAYLAAARSGELTARVTGALWWRREDGLDQLEHLRGRRRRASAGRFRATAVKIMQDGVCENHTAALLSPYAGMDGEVGMSFIPPESLRAAVASLVAEEFDLHMHAVGDRAVRECLDALEAAGPESTGRDPRHQIAHIDLIDRQDMTRMRRLGVIANIQPLWAREDKVLVETKLPYLTPDQRSRHFAFGSLAQAGVSLAMGSDWPVSSPDPLWGIHVAVNRTAPPADVHADDDHARNVPLLAGEAVGVRAAVHGYTAGAARANRTDQETGTLTVGKAADLVLLDGDPFAVDPGELSSLRVRATFVDGAPVHENW
ncbi:amidohydrolase [Modestobacter sp. VKM Ac-2978]|uniref:amidohydrolase n=1 Tax=Modestobacter sp. VKM Ac-2978 TaxID=3004132 RepID=UPI0022AA5CEC|nr:amidohydrolase [Modestobacter sp. VKM Ac-2978]MCZ2849840.1 amidohydrolase family protein [Modestobacter sp. VKM Ac-2978]